MKMLLQFADPFAPGMKQFAALGTLQMKMILAAVFCVVLIPRAFAGFDYVFFQQSLIGQLLQQPVYRGSSDIKRTVRNDFGRCKAKFAFISEKRQQQSALFRMIYF